MLNVVRPVRRMFCAGPLLLCLCFPVACNTASGAKAVATQLAATATSLAGYYGALHTELVNTDQLNTLEQGLSGVPYDAATRASILDTAAEIQKRADLANEISTLAATLTTLAGSTGAADASTAAGKVAAAAASIKPLSATLTSPVQAGIAAAAQEIAGAVLAHKMREAAAKLASLLDNLNKLYTAEEDVCTSVNTQYVSVSGDLSGALVAGGQTDAAAYTATMAKLALAPYGLTAKIDAATQARIAATAPLILQQKRADLKASQLVAGKAMEDALTDIAARAADLAAGKPLPGGVPTPSLTTVNQWAATLATK